jgi:hypothetical protein
LFTVSKGSIYFGEDSVSEQSSSHYGSQETEEKENTGRDQARYSPKNTPSPSNSLPLTRPPPIFYHLPIMPSYYESIKELIH